MYNKFQLCRGRHEIPNVDNFIFSEIVDVFDFKGMEKVAENVLRDLKVVHIYVTGLTTALTSVLNVCERYGIDTTLYHYNNETKTYIRQEMF
jgi:hypothetical protein